MLRNAIRQLRYGFNRPFMVMFESTLHCNMKCGYCAIWQNQLPENRATRQRVFARMDEAAEFGVFAWSFSGGEPLMNKNMPDYIEYAQRRGIDGLPSILNALDYIKGNLPYNTIQINAAVDLDNLEDLPALAVYCQERGFLLHTEAVHNVVRTTWQTDDVEMEGEALDKVA